MAVSATAFGVFGTGTSQTSVGLTTAADLPAGKLAVIACYVGSTGNISASDAAGNTWTALTPLADTGATTNRLVLLYAENTKALASGSTITLSSSSTTRWAVSAAYFDGMATASAFDAQVAAGKGVTPASTSTTSNATPTPSQAASLVVGATGANNGYGDTFTQPSGYTALTKGGTTGENGIFWGWKELSSAAAETYGPGTLSAARITLSGAYIFKVAAVAAAAAGVGMMMGTG